GAVRRCLATLASRRRPATILQEWLRRGRLFQLMVPPQTLRARSRLSADRGAVLRGARPFEHTVSSARAEPPHLSARSAKGCAGNRSLADTRCSRYRAPPAV